MDIALEDMATAVPAIGRVPEWHSLLKRQLDEFRRFAVLGNTTDSRRALEAAAEIIEAAIKVKQASPSDWVSAAEVFSAVRPSIVLRDDDGIGEVIRRYF